MKWIFLILVLLFIVGCKPTEKITGSVVAAIPEENGKDIEVYFCPRDGCENKLYNFLEDANSSIHCATFEMNLDSILGLLYTKSKSIDVKLFVDNDYYDEVENLSFARKDNGNQLSHNKFCIVDGKKIFTGSFNPTERCSYFNNNNMLLIESKILASNYEAEFKELWNGTFGKGAKVKNPVLKYNGILIKNYFCPEDSCSDRVIEELRNANNSIRFMTFSFTHKGIGNIVALKFNEGVDVSGVYEKKNMKGSTYDLLNYQGADVKADDNPYNMHHKVFMIDNKTVVIGSFNPTGGGDTKNDENVLIISDENVVKKYIDEFKYIWNFNYTEIDEKKNADGVILYEINYDPEGADEGKEYVMLLNTANHSVDLAYWRLSDGKNNFVLSGSVDGSSFVKFMPKFSLKNSKGTVFLRDKSINQIDYVSYEGEWNITAKTGQVLVRNNTDHLNCEECWTVR